MDHLDQILDSSSPRTSGADERVGAAVHSMVAATASRAYRRPVSGTRRRAGITALVAGLALGGGGVAVAAPSLFDWFEGRTPDRELHVTSAEGSQCTHAYRVVPDRAPENDPSVVAARASLASLDIASLDLQSAEESMAGTGLLNDSLTPDQREAEILTHAIFTAVWDDVEAQGLHSEVISFEGGTDCSDEQ